MDESYPSFDDSSYTNSYSKGDMSISAALSGFGKLRITALSNAAEISPLVKEVTIGPNSPMKKEYFKENIPDVENEKENRNVENLLEDKIGEDLRHTLMMKKYEAKLQESSEALFNNLFENVIANRTETARKYWMKKSEEYEKKALETRARKLQMLKALQDNDNLTVLDRARLDQENSKLINTQTIENMNRILEEQNKATARFAAITDSHTKICKYYNVFNNLAQNEPLAKSIVDNCTTSVNTIMDNINNIMDLCKTGTLTDKEVKQADILAANMDNIKTKINAEIDKIIQEEVAKNQQELELAMKKEMEAKLAQEAAQRAAEEKAKEERKTGPLFYSPKNHTTYLEHQQFLEEYEAKYKDLLENTNLKKFRFDCQKAVNTPVNALSSVSGHHIRDKFDKLLTLLRGERVQVLDIHIAATQHPQGLYYCTALLAKKIVRQGELLVSSNPEAAFPLAAVTVALWSQFPEFGMLLEAYFHRYCPYLVPMFLPQKQGQTDKEFYLSRGYTYNDEGVVEKQDKFLKRMSGIFRLHCAIWIAKTPKFLNTQNPHSLCHAWRWLASFVNLKPEPDISATLLHDFFIVCGSEFLKFYGNQFKKIMNLIRTDYFAILQNIDEGGPKTRLEVFLKDVETSNRIPPPNGLLPPNSW